MVTGTIPEDRDLTPNASLLRSKLEFLCKPEILQTIRVLCIGSDTGSDRSAQYGKIKITLRGYKASTYKTSPVEIEIEGGSRAFDLNAWSSDPEGLAIEMDAAGIQDADLEEFCHEIDMVAKPAIRGGASPLAPRSPE